MTDGWPISPGQINRGAPFLAFFARSGPQGSRHWRGSVYAAGARIFISRTCHSFTFWISLAEGIAANWKSFQDDPEWKSVREKSEVNGKLTEKIDYTFLVLTDFSPPLR